MKANTKVLVIFSVMITLLSCSGSEEAEKPADKQETNDTLEPNAEVSDYGSGTSGFTAVYEKLIASSTYSHFYQGNSSTFPWLCCLPTSYMMAKGLIRNIQVNDATLQPIITGMNTDSSGASGTDGFIYAKADLGEQCADYSASDFSGAFDKIYNAIDSGFPIIALINIRKVNGTYQLETDTRFDRHWVCIVGIRVESFAAHTGEINYIDPLSQERQIKTALISTFLNSALRASDITKVNLLRIGCQSDAITANYFGTSGGALFTAPADNAVNVSIPALFSWQAISATSVYRIQVSKSLTGWTADNGFPDNADRIVNHNNESQTSYFWNIESQDIREAPLNNAVYYCTLKSYTNGISSNYSPPIQFKTAPGAITAPTAIAATNITSTGFTCNWTVQNPITNGGYYAVVVATDVNFNNILPNCPQYVTATNLTWTTLNSNTWYYYKIQTFTNSGTSPFSNVISVKTE